MEKKQMKSNLKAMSKQILVDIKSIKENLKAIRTQRKTIISMVKELKNKEITETRLNEISVIAEKYDIVEKEKIVESVEE